MEQQIERLLNHIEPKLKIEDIALKSLLKPLQITLNEQIVHQKHSHVSQDVEKKSILKRQNISKITKSSSDIANGLKIVVKSSIEDNKFSLKDFERNQATLNKPNTLKAMKELQQDNLLYFLKADLGGDGAPIVKTNSLSICVCMYSEPKSMLRDTLRGVEENVVGIVKSGTNCDEVTVVVVIDGIETMNKDMVSFFEETERITNTYIEEQDNADFDMVSKKIQGLYNDHTNSSYTQTLNFSYALFNSEQFDERNRRKFKNVYKKYTQIKEIKQKINEMKKNIPIFENLPGVVRDIFLKIAEEQYYLFMIQKRNSLQSQVKVSDIKSVLIEAEIEKNKIIDYSVNNMSRYRSILMKALQQTQKFCDEYMSNRENLAYLASFRKKLFIDKGQEDAQISVIRENPEQKVELQAYMNLLVCVKYKNSGKLSSHNWFFNGFCKQIHPKYTVLLDVGLRPNADALFKMYSYLRGHEDVGGVCGYMGLKIERLEEKEEVTSDQVDALSAFMLNFVDIQRAQQLEYHFAHLIDKPFESLFDFIHVLPGAFSAYNMTTLTQIDGSGHNLLKEYFKSIDQKLASNKIRSIEISSFGALVRVLLPESVHRCLWKVDPDSEEVMLECENINLAQDRILCMGIHKVGKKMHFLPDAYSMVDPMKTVHSLMGQRRRWINGSMFAFNKVKSQLNNVKSSQCFLGMQLLFLSIINLLAYISPAIFLFTVHLAMEAFRSDILPLLFGGVIVDADHSTFFDAFVYTVDFIYVLILGSLVFLSLNLPHSDQKFRPYIYFISTILGLLQLGVFILFAVDLIRSTSGSQTFLQTNLTSTKQLPGGESLLAAFRWLLVLSVLIFIFPIILFGILFKRSNVFFEMISGFLSSIFYLPSYLIIFNIFALCRIDDISWGTKGLYNQQTNKSQSLRKTWESLKYIQVYKFIFWNIIAGVVIVSFGSSYVPRFFICLVILLIVLAILLVKMFFGGLYLLRYLCIRRIELIFTQIQPQQKIQSELSLLRRDVLAEIKQNLMKIRQYVQKDAQCNEFQSLRFDSNTLSRVNFIKRAIRSANKSQIKVKGQQGYKLPIQSKYRIRLPKIQQVQRKKKSIDNKRLNETNEELVLNENEDNMSNSLALFKLEGQLRNQQVIQQNCTPPLRVSLNYSHEYMDIQTTRQKRFQQRNDSKSKQIIKQ